MSSKASAPPSPETRRTSATASQLGANERHDVLVHASAAPASSDDVCAALDDAWDAIRENKLPPSPGLIVLIAPPLGDAHRAAARAGLENLSRTLSVEWARFQIRPVTILPGEDSEPVAELVAFLASEAGAYYAGCTFTLR
jgi:NAD(P)-dependent dehydrogenase (short-subunit alcohol dehydrogenase family)